MEISRRNAIAPLDAVLERWVRQRFDSGSAALGRYLREQAMQDIRRFERAEIDAYALVVDAKDKLAAALYSIYIMDSLRCRPRH